MRGDIASMAAAQAARSPTSNDSARERPPSFAMSSCSAARRSGCALQWTTTPNPAAPSASATAWPMPRLAPVNEDPAECDQGCSRRLRLDIQGVRSGWESGQRQRAAPGIHA